MNRPRHNSPSNGKRTTETARRAGAYGFTRSEIVILSVIGVVVIALSVAQWVKRREASQIPPWRIEDVLIDTLPPPFRMAGSPVRTTGDVAKPDYALTDVNVAAHQDLILLPGIGPVLAERIIDERHRGGRFKNLVDLQRVRGIGPKKAAALAGWVRFSQPVEEAVDSLDTEQ